jgi:HEAT repeat protein
MKRSNGIVLAASAALAMGAISFAQDRNLSLAELLDQFQTTNVGRQFDVGKQIVRVGDVRTLQVLEPWLGHEDRHLRGNAAFVFASFGDARGFEALRGILTDRSSRPMGQGIPGGSFNPAQPAWWLPAQIRADRHYAVLLLGQLRDPRAFEILVPLLDDAEIDYEVARALGEIGDRRAIRPLIAALRDRHALVRTLAIQSLEKLRATEALPAIRALLADRALPSAGDQVSVGETAQAAIAKLQREP